MRPSLHPPVLGYWGVVLLLLAACSKPTVTMGIISARDPGSVRQAYAPLQHYLEAQTGTTIVLDPVVSHADGLRRLRHRSWDLAFATSQTYLEARSFGYRALAMVTEHGRSYYHAVLIVPQTSSLREARGLKGHSVAFVSKKSASGYTYPMKILLDAGLSPTADLTMVFTGNVAAIGATLRRPRGDAAPPFEAGAVYDGYLQEDPAVGRDVRVIARSGDIPHVPVIVGGAVARNKTLTARFRQALLDAKAKAPDAFRDKAIYFDGFVPAQEALYDRVAAIEAQVKAYEAHHPVLEAAP